MVKGLVRGWSVYVQLTYFHIRVYNNMHARADSKRDLVHGIFSLILDKLRGADLAKKRIANADTALLSLSLPSFHCHDKYAVLSSYDNRSRKSFMRRRPIPLNHKSQGNE